MARFLLIGVTLCTIATTPPAVASRVEANRLFEHTFTAARAHDNPSNDVMVDVLVTDPRGTTRRVPAFWAGGNTWKVRYASPIVGRHTFVSKCSAADDPGLHGVTGEVEIVPYTGANPLYRHGPVRVAEDRRHFAYADGTPFFWLADTWWMGLCQRLHWPDEVKTLAADRKEKGFNVIQIVAGLYPDMDPFDRRGDNEAGGPWTKDYAHINPAYFDFADRRLMYLADTGFVPAIVGAWGYYLPRMGTEKIKRHWRYLIARYSALPVVWVAAGEGTMPYYLSKDRKGDAALQKREWTSVIRSMRAIDPFGRMITIHPSRSARDTVDDPSLLDFDMHQTGHRFRDSVGKVVTEIRSAYATRPTMPVISGEASYDGLDLTEWRRPGDGRPTVIPSSASRLMFWACIMNNGAAGSTYGANGIWQVNRRRQPYGPSPHGRSWGSIPWDKAMRRPGSRQVGLAKRLLEEHDWSHFQPHPQWASWATGTRAAGGPPPPQSPIEPLAAGIAGKVRIVYVIDPRPVLVHQLQRDAHYSASTFDPVTGQHTKIGQIAPSADGTWLAPVPKTDHDWVLILTRRAATE